MVISYLSPLDGHWQVVEIWAQGQNLGKREELAGENASDISWKEEIGNCISPLSNSAKPKEMC